MSELLVKFDEPISAPGGLKYFAQAVGKETDGGLWEGWLEFTTDEPSRTLSSDRETTQPNQRSVEYWAQGLTRVYLEGALARASAPTPNPGKRIQAETQAPRSAAPRQVSRPYVGAALKARPILDPFAVYAQGEQILRSELGALSRNQVETIASAYGFVAPGSTGEAGNSSDRELVDAVVDGVRSAEAR